MRFKKNHIVSIFFLSDVTNYFEMIRMYTSELVGRDVLNT